MKLLAIRFVTKQETDPDLSHIGEYTDKPEPWAIVRDADNYLSNLEKDENWVMPIRGRYCRFFKPTVESEKEGSADYQKYGLQEYQLMEAYERGEWCILYAFAEAEIIIGGTVQHLQSNGCGGIMSTDTEGLASIREEELAALYEILAEISGEITPSLLATFTVKDVSR